MTNTGAAAYSEGTLNGGGAPPSRARSRLLRSPWTAVIVAAALLLSFLDRASSGIGLNTDVPKEVTSIMGGVIILTIVIAYELVRRMTARRQLREQHELA